MAERTIEGFNHIDFAKNLASQAGEVVPADISPEDKKFVVDIVYKFCFLCGDALIKDETVNLNAPQASLVTQFIGEWSFHKSIDLIRAKIDSQLREGILQRVAFTVFEIAKQAVIKQMPQEQIIPLVEHHVNVCFKQALDDLKAKGVLDEAAEQSALNQSNIDAMAQAEAASEEIGADMSDTKILKLASLAILIKNFPEPKIKNILSKFNKPEREVLLQYLSMKDLESKIDSKIATRCLQEIKQTLPEPKALSIDRVCKKMYKIIKNSNEQTISNIIKDERPLIREFVINTAQGEETKMPVRVASVVCKYLEDKCNANKEEV